jgi:hypothetical protein
MWCSIASWKRTQSSGVESEGVVAEILEAGGKGDLVANGEHLVEEGFKGVGILKAAGGDGFPRFLTALAVGLFLDARHADKGLFLAVELDGHRAGEFLVLLRELGDLRFARDVFLAIDFYLGFDAAAVDVVVGGELREGGRRDELLHERELARLQPGLDHFDDVHVGALARFVVGLAGHRDVGERG